MRQTRRRLYELALEFAEIHCGDGDILGEHAIELLDLLKFYAPVDLLKEKGVSL